MQIKEPGAAGEEEGETIGAAGDIIDGRTVDRVNDPKQRHKKCGGG